MGKKPVIKLRVYRGTELNYDENRNIKNENHLISIEHNSRMWVLFKKNVLLNGYCKVSVEKAFVQNEKGEYDEIKDLSVFENEIKEAFTDKANVKVSPQEARIAELEAKLEALINGSKKEPKKEPKKEKKEVSDENLDDLRAEYEVKMGKKPFNGWDADKLKEKMAEA